MLKLTKKLGIAVLAATASMAFAATAFGATLPSGGVWEAGSGASSENAITIPKQIVFVNAESTTVREPNIVYTYTLSAATPGGATVEDENGNKGTVKEGVIAANTNTNHAVAVTYADTNTASATSDGTADQKTFTFNFDPTQFSGPGIYRYLVTETQSPTKASVGVTEASTYANTRYLDVYVRRAETGSSTMVIYGYVLSEGSATTSFDGDPATNLDKKSSGYVDTGSSGSPADVDVYTTQNMHIAKDVQGVLADPENDFPIALTMAPPANVTAPKIDVAVAGGGAVNGTSSDSVGTYIVLGNSTGTVDDDSTIDLTGLPANSTVSIVETNNTSDSYKVKAGTTAGAVDLLAEATVAASANSGATATQTLSTTQSAYITNTLDAISPTGIVLRYGPFAAMLVGGLVLLLVATRRKNENMS
jgi:hypothetical protein